jgi:iron complex outermembrane recepter protein
VPDTPTSPHQGHPRVQSAGDHRSPVGLAVVVHLCLWAVSVAVLVCLASGGSAHAQEPQHEEGESEPNDLVAPQVRNQVSPVYPHGAVGEAEVKLQVTVSAAGVVTLVEPLSGPEPFVLEATEAALQLLFAPARRGGVPVEATVVVTFHFAPRMEPHPLEDEVAMEIVVEARRVESEDMHARTTIEGEALERTRGQDFAESIAQVPGVTVGRGTGDSTKPIIRGQYERRLLVLFDGVRLESQKWGADHATEIDPFSAGQISVIRGAAGVRYGPDAIGGVVLVEPPPLRFEPGVEGNAQVIGVSNGQRGVGALRLDFAPAAAPGLALRVQGNYARGAALSTPDHVLGNTGSEQWNFGARARYHRDLSTLTLAYQHYDLRAGLCYCVRNSTTGDFLGQLDADAPVGAENWSTSYRIDRPYQSVAHDLALARTSVSLRGGGALEATYAVQINQRREYESARESVTGAQYDFTLRTHSLDLQAQHGALGLGSVGTLAGSAGLSGSFQENVYGGLPLIPNHRTGSAGAFAFERLSTKTLDVELGGRYDHQSRTSFLTDSALEGHLARDTLQEDDCDRSADGAAACALGFDAASVSAGVLWHEAADRLELKLDLSSASRFPNGDELYMNGSAPTAPVYALGDPGLGVETTWGTSGTVGMRLSWLDLEASTYGNLINDYIAFAPALGRDGEPEFDVTIRGAYPRFAFRAIDAVFYGFDGGFTLAPEAPLAVVAQASIVRADNRTTHEPLLFTPPDRVRVGAQAQPGGLGPFAKNSAEVSVEYVARQNRVVEGADLAPPPDAYVVLGASVGAEVLLRGEKRLSLGLEGANLLNTRYRDYTSLLRYFADEPGRELRLRLGLDF